MKRKTRYGKSLALFVILVGLMVAVYPFIRITKNEIFLKGQIKRYETTFHKLSQAEVNEIIRKGESYNEGLIKNANGVVDPFVNSGFDTSSPVPNIQKNGIFGYISIPKIGETLPLYLGANEKHLSLGAAQIDGTSMPLGGDGNRCVIAGQRGYYSRFMFRFLDKLQPGDRIDLYVMDKKLSYVIDNTEESYPSQNAKLAPVAGEDTLTLLTGTPYPSNKMRLLVNAARIEDTAYTGDIFQDINETKQSIGTDRGVSIRKLMVKVIAIAGSVLWMILLASFAKNTYKLMGLKKDTVNE